MLKNNYIKFKEIVATIVSCDDDRQQEQNASENDGVLKTPIALTSAQSVQWQHLTPKRRGVMEVQVRILDIDLTSTLEIHDKIMESISGIADSNTNIQFDSTNGFWIAQLQIKVGI